jgi:hypothetical protein
MRVGMIQSNYIPWRGYFDFIDSVDVFVLYDDVPFGQGRKWRNRNKIRTPSGTAWLTVPIHRGPSGTPIDRVEICYDTDWIASHCHQIYENYRRAPFYRTYIDQFSEILHQRFKYLSALNEALLRWVGTHLSIDTLLIRVRDLQVPQGSKISRPLEILRHLGATEYLTGPNTLAFSDFSEYRTYNIDVLIKTYSYPQYPQCWGGFCDDVSILDLLFNRGYILAGT